MASWVDMRKGFEGLYALATQQMGREVLRGDLFLSLIHIFFLMAMRASAVYKKNDNRAITLLPKEIGDAAIKMAASYPKNRDKEIGQWFISLLGYKQDETTKVIKEVTDLIKGHNASKDAYQKYRNLVHEADAFAITSAIRLKMKSEFSTLNEDETFAGLQELFTDKD